MSSSSTPSQQPSSDREVQHFDRAGKPLPSIALKWGWTPRDNHTFESDKEQNSQQQRQRREEGGEDASTTNESTSDNADGQDSKVDWESYYSPEEAAALRAKGINPALKAEMDHHTSKGEGRGFWSKVAQTSMGGGWIK